MDGWTDADFERSYATGKWSARKILAHLAQTELALTTRARFALTTENYQAQSFDQDQWMPLDEHVDARTRTRHLYDAAADEPGDVARASPTQQMKRPFFHPDFGDAQRRLDRGADGAAHDIHHLKQFQQIAAARRPAAILACSSPTTSPASISA